LKTLSVVHLTSVHSPLDHRIFHKECLALADSGHEVLLIAPDDGEVTDERVRIHTVPKPTGRFERMTRTLGELYRAAMAIDADVYHFHDPELLPLGMLLKLRGKRVVYDVHEDLPRQIQSKYWIPRWLRPLVAFGVAVAERPAAGILDGIVAATPRIARRFPRRKTETVRNFPVVEELAAAAGLDYCSRGPIVTYVGAITEERGIREMVEAVGRLPESLGVRLHLAGRFVPAGLCEEVSRLEGWKRVNYSGFQSRKGVAELLGKSRAGLVLLHPEPNYVEALPVKLFEYMAAGLPVIVSDFPLWREIVGSAKCGVLVDPRDSGAIADAARWILDHPEEAEQMGRKGRDAVLQQYNWRSEAEKLIKFYTRMMS